MSNRDYNSQNIHQYDSYINATAAKYNIDPNLLAITMAREDQSGDPKIVNPQAAANGEHAAGLMQFLPSTFKDLEGGGSNAKFDPTTIFDPATNIDAAGRYYRRLLDQNGQDEEKAVLGFAIGEGALKSFLADPANHPLSNEAQGALSLWSEAANKPSALLALNGTPGGATPSIPLLQPNDAAATPATAKFGVPYPTETSSDIAALQALQDAINPSLIINSGLDETPWYKDPNIARSKRPQPVAHPVTFKVYFDQKKALTNSANKPIVICLNASLSTFSKSMQHIVSRQHTRTGVLIDFWGSNPDIVTGEGSTGLFLNQVGITSYFSLAKPTDKIKKAITAAFTKRAHRVIIPKKTPTDLTQAAFSKIASLVKPPTTPTKPTGDAPPPPLLPTNNFFLESSLRVGARDAFAELLSLFKNNGVVYFRSDTNNTGLTTSEQQVGLNAWSSKFGRSTYQAANSRSDVMTRGRVEMSFRNTLYSGYFKSLSWTMAADKPYSWDFNFVFQVESSTTQVDVAPTKQQYGKLQAMTTPPPATPTPETADPLLKYAANGLTQAPPYVAPAPGTVPPYIPPPSIYNPLTWK